MIILVIIFCPLAYLAPYKGKVIDAETKKPIEGAAVLIIYYNESPTIAGSSVLPADAQEAVTDSKGEFNIPWRIARFGILNWYPEAGVKIFKPGYGFFPRHRLSEAIGANRSWPPAYEYIVYEIPKLHTKEEKRKNLPPTYNRIPYQKKARYFEDINKERIGLGLEPLTIPDEEK